MAGDDKSTNYSLSCGLCKADFSTRAQWYVHLVGDEHQHQARLGMMGWEKEEREAVLMTFSNALMDKEGGKLLRWIAGKNWKVIVTDFIWWTDRPKVAFVRFEGREALERALDRCQVRGQPEGIQVFFRKAGDLLDFEWLAFLPEQGHPDNLKDSGSELALQFEAISKPVRVPVEEWNYIRKLFRYLVDLGKTANPPFQIRFFRHSYFKLRLPGSSTIWLIQVSSNGSPLPAENLADLLNKICHQRKVIQVVDDQKEKLKMGTEFYGQEKSYGLNFNFSFTIVTFRKSIVESQLSRLTEYLLGFDARCIPLFTLLYFWYGTNELRLCLDDAKMKRTGSPKCVPGPAALDWILISFLGGVAKLIPTARQVLKRPHTPVYALKDNQLDVGFKWDSDFWAEWKELRKDESKPGSNAFYLNVVDLAKQFFEYYAKLLKKGRWILNTRDGDMLRSKSIVKMSKTIPNDTGLSAQEIEEIRQTEGVDFKSTRLYIPHPFYLLWQLGVNNEEVAKMQVCMEETAIKLEKWIDIQRERGHSKGNQVDLVAVLKVEELGNSQ